MGPKGEPTRSIQPSRDIPESPQPVAPQVNGLGDLTVPPIGGAPSSSHPERSHTEVVKPATSSERSPSHENNPGNLPAEPTQPTLVPGAIRKLGTAIGSTVCFSFTGVFNQAARGDTTDIALYPNPFLYCTLRSTVASVATYLKDRASFQKTGLLRSFQEIGPHGQLMCGLMAINNLLWIPAFMLTDLASALVITGAQPFMHSIYESVRSGKPPSAIKLTGLGFTGAALGTVLLNQSTASTDYPYAVWGNLAVLAASLCFAGYMTINNRLVESARSRAVSSAEVERAKMISSAPERQHAEQEHETLRARAQDAAQARLRAVPFFSQVASACVGLAFFIPQVSLGGFSNGLGLNPLNTVVMGTLHGLCTAAGLYLRTRATQTNQPSTVSLIAGVQIGLTPLFGYLLFGSSVPQFAMLAGALAFCSSLTSVAEVHLAERKRQSSATS